MSRARARARLRRPTGLRRGSTAEQPREPAGSIARRPPSRRARTTVPSRAAHERWGAVPRESPLHLHFHQAEVCTGRAPQLHAVCLAHIRRCKRTAAECAARLVVELVGEPVLAQAAPARTRAHCRPTSLARLHECKTPTRSAPVVRRAGCGGRTAAARPNLYACASAGAARCAACTACCNTVQHAATCCTAAQRVCVAPATVPVPQDARPVRCVRHGKAKAHRLRQPDRLRCCSASNVHAAAPALYCRADVSVHVRVRLCEEMRVCACPRAVAGGEGVARHGGGGWRRARTGADVDKQKQVRTRLLVELLRRVHEHVVAPHLCRAESESDTACAYRGCGRVPIAEAACAD